jgi:hypothetical protein
MDKEPTLSQIWTEFGVLMLLGTGLALLHYVGLGPAGGSAHGEAAEPDAHWIACGRVTSAFGSGALSLARQETNAFFLCR